MVIYISRVCSSLVWRHFGFAIKVFNCAQVRKLCICFLVFLIPSLYIMRVYGGVGYISHFCEIMQFSLPWCPRRSLGKLTISSFFLSQRRKWNSIPLSLLFCPTEDRAGYGNNCPSRVLRSHRQGGKNESDFQE